MNSEKKILFGQKYPAKNYLGITEGENKISIKTGESTIERFFEPDSDDSTSYFLQNAIEDALEEFGDTLELNQKVSVLVKALEELLSK